MVFCCIIKFVIKVDPVSDVSSKLYGNVRAALKFKIFIITEILTKILKKHQLTLSLPRSSIDDFVFSVFPSNFSN